MLIGKIVQTVMKGGTVIHRETHVFMIYSILNWKFNRNKLIT